MLKYLILSEQHTGDDQICPCLTVPLTRRVPGEGCAWAPAWSPARSARGRGRHGEAAVGRPAAAVPVCSVSLQPEAHPLSHFSLCPPCRGRTGLPGGGGGTGGP